MANQLLTSQVLTNESLMVLNNDTIFVPLVNTSYSSDFGKKGAKVGDTEYIRKPDRFLGRDGQAYNPEGIVDTQVPLTINQQSGVDFEFSTADMYLSLDEIRSRILDPAMISIGNNIDYRVGQTLMLNTGNLVGTAGTTPGLSATDAFLIYSTAGQRLVEAGFPKRTGLNLALNAQMETGWNTFAKPFFNPSGKLSKQWDTGRAQDFLNYNVEIDENVPKQVIGTLGGTPAVSGAGQTGNSITVSGLTASITGWGNIGDQVTFAGVFAVNPQTRVSTGSLKGFSLQAQVNSDGSGNATFVLNEAIVTSGAFQNVTGSPANGALINVYGANAAGQAALSGLTTTQGLMFNKNALAFASFPGEIPKNADMASTSTSKETGLSIRFVRIFDAYRDQWVNRFDVYYGMAPLYVEAGCRIAA